MTMASRLRPNRRTSDHPHWSAIAAQLDAMHLRAYTPEELRAISNKLRTAITIGFKRNGPPTTTDGGVLAAPTGIQHITLEDVQRVPNHTRGITAACGGTNWIFAETEKEPSGQVTIGRSFIRKIPEKERQHTFDGFVEIIADGVAHVARDCELTDVAELPISISLGFPQINLETAAGDIDARIPTSDLPKFWKITDYNSKLPVHQQPSIADTLRRKLTAKGVHGVESIAIVNDTVAVALDVQHGDGEEHDAPVGFVFGTGTNGAMYGGKKKGMVNLEIGHAAIMGNDPLLSIMHKRGWTPDARQVMEYWMGGAFISARVLAALVVLKKYLKAPESIIKQIAASQNQALMSDMAKGRPSPLLGISMTADDYMVAHACADRAMRQAAQMIAVHLATVCDLVGSKSGTVFVPYEGSVLGKGYHMKKRALENAKVLLPHLDIKPYEASGMVGVAKLAMVRMLGR